MTRILGLVGGREAGGRTATAVAVRAMITEAGGEV